MIDNSANAARSSLNNLNESFNQKAGSAIFNDTEALGQVGSAEKLSAGQKANLKNQYNANYSGPNDLFDQGLSGQYTDANKKLNTAAQNVAGVGTEQGRKGLIGQVNNKARTTGATNFDNALLQSGEGRQKLAGAALANKDVTGDLLGNANLNAQTKAGGIRAQTDNIRNQTQAAVSGATNTFNQSINDKVKAAMDKAATQNNAINEDISDLNLDQETLDLFGLTDGQATYGNPSLKDYYTAPTVNDINAGNVASGEDYQRYLALSELAGVDPSTLKAGDIGKAETAPGAKFNKDKLAADIQARKAAYFNEYKTGNMPMPSLAAYGVEQYSGGAYTPEFVESHVLPALMGSDANLNSSTRSVTIDPIKSALASLRAKHGTNMAVRRNTNR